MTTYKFKNPITKEWVDIVAENFQEAMQQLRALIDASK